MVRPLFAALVATGAIAPATAATINVTTGGDAGTGVTCTVRQAVASINGGALVDGCALASGVFGTDDTVDLALQTGTIGLVSGPLLPTLPIRFSGPGATTLTISGQGASRVIEAFDDDVIVDGLRIANGRSEGIGGCIAAQGLQLTNSIVSGCTATPSPLAPFLDGVGGGVSAKYLLSYRSTISGNTASQAGGGVFMLGGILVESLVTGNSVTGAVCPSEEECVMALFGGGGVLGGTVLAQASTISGNTLNASQFTKYDDDNQPYDIKIGLGGGISQLPLETIYEEYFGYNEFAAKARPRRSLNPFGPATGQSRVGAQVKAKVAAVQAGAARQAGAAKKGGGAKKGGARAKVDGIGDYGLVGLLMSTVSGNRVSGGGSAPGKYGGGGVFSLSYYNAEFANSTISGNRLDTPVGGYETIGSAFLGAALDMSNTTITGNIGDAAVAMKYGAPEMLLPGSAKATKAAPGAKMLAAARAKVAQARAQARAQQPMQAPSRSKSFKGRNKVITGPVWYSTIVGGNASAIYDVTCGGPCTIAGSNNLITLPGFGTFPPDTLNVGPFLAPLANNGGIAAGAPGTAAIVQTHALYIGSPAIDAGFNDEGFEFDQRGPGFPRTVGLDTDIGAYEGAIAAPVAVVPTLGGWMLGALSALLGLAGLRARRRRPVG